MDTKIKNSRSNFEKLGSNYKIADNIEIKKEFIESVPCYWFYKTNNKSNSKVILYLHGGCYALGSINSHKALVSHLAFETDSTFLFVEYSLSPENVFPTAVNEILKVYNHLVNHSQVADISFMGDSAGSGLMTTVVSILNREKKSSNLHCCIMISPWIDLRNESHSVFNKKKIDPVLAKESLDFFASLYIGDNTLSKANPIETLFGIFPPTLILVGTNEILLDDSGMIYSKIVAKQPSTELIVFEDQTHVWLLDNIHSESAKKAIDKIKSFLSLRKT